MKVVINSCFGGFSLSNKAEKMYAKRKHGYDLYFYKQTKYTHSHDYAEYEKVDPENNNSLFTSVSKKDLGDVVRDGIPEEHYYYESFYDDATRCDPILIEVIEELGEEVASGSCAALSIVEIPDGVEFEISEYDGNEHVAEKHRRWR